LVLLLILGGVSVYSITDIVDTNRWVNHTRVVLADSSAIVSSAVDMETGMRGYLLAGQEDFLDPYRSGRVHIPMIATGYSDRSRPPIPTHRDHFCGRGCVAV